MAYDNILVEIEGAIAVVTVNRPRALNALNRQTIDELVDAFEAIAGQHDIRAAIVTGAGEKAFVAGADIAEMAKMASDEASAFAARGHDLGATLGELPQPVIAAVNGYALGGGTELALACDFVYASDNAKFGQPEVNLGVIPGFGGTQRFARRCGGAIAMELITTGETIGAQEALRIGLVNKVFPLAELLPAARAAALKIAQKGPIAIAAAKRAVRAADEMALSDGLQFEIKCFASLFDTEDQKEGMAAFLGKRAANFTGR